MARRTKPKFRRFRLIAPALGGVLIVSGAGYLGYAWATGPSPSAAVSAYLSAMSRADYPSAYQGLSSASKKSVTGPDGLRQTAIGTALTSGTADSFTVGQTTKLGDKAQVEVRLTKGPTAVAVNIICERESGRWRVQV